MSQHTVALALPICRTQRLQSMWRKRRHRLVPSGPHFRHAFRLGVLPWQGEVSSAVSQDELPGEGLSCPAAEARSWERLPVLMA
eukprot:scaffold530783_cov47-Prasinocladus_malaysianus.AAC.2